MRRHGKQCKTLFYRRATQDWAEALWPGLLQLGCT